MVQRKRNNRRKQLSRDGDDRYKAFVQNTSEGIWCVEFNRKLYIDVPEVEQFNLVYRHGYITEANDMYAQSVGYERGEDLVGTRIEEFCPRSEPTNIATVKNWIRERYNVTNAETVESFREGVKRYFLNNSTPFIEDGCVVRVWGTQTDITAQKVLEEKLRKAEQMYRTVADFTYDWEYWVNVDGKLNYVSPSCERISGYTVQEFIENPSLFREIIVPDDKAVWDEHKFSVQEDVKPAEIELRIRRKDGEIRWIEHVCQPVLDHQGNNQGVRASNRDITKRAFYRSETHKLQSELAHMDRVVTISTLTSALAHEINQPLAAMRSYAQAALRFMGKAHPDYDSVQKALQGIVADNKRAADVVNRLRELVKKEPAHWGNIDINLIINDVIRLINSELVLRNASITLDLNSDISVIQGDSVQIQQVLINLLINALDAMDDQPIGKRKITVSTKPENLKEIIVSISDFGGGIPSDNIQAIFSPFFTTKSTGMGLGLSICRSIVKAHGGKIWAKNNLDGGATISLILPAGSKSK
jgi:PAS domain S-box-containing protein